MTQLPESANEQPDQILLPSVAQNLKRLGLSPDTIAHVTGAPRATIREIVRTRPTVPEEEELATQVRGLFTLAISQAHRILEWGPAEQRIAIIRSLLSGSAIRFAHSSGGDTQETRRELELLWEETRKVEVPAEVVQPTGEVYEEYGPSSGTATQPIDDQD